MSVLAAPPSPPRAFVTSTGVRFELHEFGEGHERVFHGSWIWRDVRPLVERAAQHVDIVVVEWAKGAKR